MARAARGNAKKPDEIRPEDAAVGARIVEAREKIGMSQATLARELGCIPTTLWRYETGRIAAATRLVEIAQITGASAEWLRNGSGETTDERTRVVEEFIANHGPTLRPPLTSSEARFLRAWPYHHRVTVGKLLDMVNDGRRGASAEEMAASEKATEEARERGAKLGVPMRRAR